jgi:hypothetical protein
MTDHPILYSAPMVRAKLAGRKTQTRRIVSAQNLKFFNPERGRLEATPTMIEGAFLSPGEIRQHDRKGGWNWQARVFGNDLVAYALWQARSKIQVGDRLWARESFMPVPMEVPPESPRATMWHIAYAAGGDSRATAAPGYNPMLYNYERWSPSIHMPRAFSRITDTVTEIRLQRLQDITKADALAEGVYFDPACDGYTIGRGTHYHPNDPIQSYKSLWNTINGDEGPKSWDGNPWVLAYTSTVRLSNIDAEAA